jgi:hypothetical protein
VSFSLFQTKEKHIDLVVTFCSSFSSVSLMASTLAASLKSVHPPPTTIPSSTAACEEEEAIYWFVIITFSSKRKVMERYGI